MTGRTFDAFTRQLGRRRALQALGTAALATVSGVALADARKGKNNNGNNKQKNKKQRKNIEEQALALCAAQVTECDALSAATCEGDAECLAKNQLCCDLLATCAFTEFIACINEPSENDDNL
jgi:hypothetical protein